MRNEFDPAIRVRHPYSEPKATTITARGIHNVPKPPEHCRTLCCCWIMLVVARGHIGPLREGGGGGLLPL